MKKIGQQNQANDSVFTFSAADDGANVESTSGEHSQKRTAFGEKSLVRPFQSQEDFFIRTGETRP